MGKLKVKVKEVVILYVLGKLVDEFEFYSIYKVLGIEIREKKYRTEIAYILMIFNKNSNSDNKTRNYGIIVIGFFINFESYTI